MPPRTRHASDFAQIQQLVAERAALQANVFRRTDLVAWGIDPEVCATMLRRRAWLRLRHGVYADAEAADRAAVVPRDAHCLHLAGALAALEEPAGAFGVSAAHVRRLPLPRTAPDCVHLLRPTGQDHRVLKQGLRNAAGAPPIRFTGHSLDGLLMESVDSITVVDRQLAALSAAAALAPDWAVAVMDAACFGDPQALDRMRSLADDWPLLLGIGTVRRALPHVRVGAQTPLESLSRLRLVRGGLPEPRLQVPIYDDEGLVGIVDMLFDEWGVIGEADGLLKYDDRGMAFRAEKSREDRLRALGFIVVRWTWDEIINRPMLVVQRIRQAARARGLFVAG